MKQTKTLCDVQECNQEAKGVWFYDGPRYLDAAGSTDYDQFGKDLCVEHRDILLGAAISKLPQEARESLYKAFTFKRGS